MALQLQFYKPNPNSQTVVDSNGNPVSLADYKRITGQQNIPDNKINWSYIQSGSPPTSQGTQQTQQPTLPQAAPPIQPIQLPVNQTNNQTFGFGNGAQYDINGNPVNTTAQNIATNPPTNQAAPITTPPGNSATGNPQYDQLLAQLQTYLDQLQKNGQVINPNVQITPDQIAQFTAQAATQIHPYYATQLQAATSQFLGNLGYNLQSYNDQIAKAQTDYGRQLDTLGANAADQGFAQSGIRQKQEGQLASDTQYSLDQARNAFTNSSQNTAASFANTYGGANTPTAPTIGASPRVLPGQNSFSTSGSNAGLYTLDPGIYNQLIGTQQNAEKSATDTLSSQLQNNFVKQQSNNQVRTLNI